jgi:hypothetical protein
MDEVQCHKAAQMWSETKEVVACFSISESIKVPKLCILLLASDGSDQYLNSYGLQLSRTRKRGSIHPLPSASS